MTLIWIQKSANVFVLLLKEFKDLPTLEIGVKLQIAVKMLILALITFPVSMGVHPLESRLRVVNAAVSMDIMVIIVNLNHPVSK